MTPAVEALRRAKISHELLSYEHDPTADSYGLEAAEALALDPAVVFKTLVVELAGFGLAVAVVPATQRLNLKAVAKAFRAKKAVMADPLRAERSTGYVLGGISPLGQRKRLPTVIDETAASLGLMHVSAGRRGLEIAVSPRDLITATEAIVAPITAPNS
ncbi:MAG: Cys-tRNA(Pro) deacylase [Acidimicrobiales bacterium]|nr:Cys-tRNA(Pro) deacylase [Acidimicrobiales bacterium]